MIEKMIPIEIPPGLQMNGGLMEKQGRWMDGNNVRFHEGVPKALGARAVAFPGLSLASGAPQGSAILTIETSVGIFALVASDTDVVACYVDVIAQDVAVDAVTPAAGLVDQGNFHTWSFAAHGDNILFSRAGPVTSGAVYVLDASSTPLPLATSLANVPTAAPRGVFVTPEKFLMVIDVGKTIHWADQSDITIWTPASTNTAGSLDLPSKGIPYVGRAVGSETLVWTSEDLWELPYLNDDELYYGRQLKADACGIVGANALAVDGNVARWMGPNGFFQYDGFVSPIPCPLYDYIFSDIDISAGHQFFTLSNPQFHEVQWWYVSASSGFNYGPDRFVIYNYQNNTWSKGEITGALNFSAGASGWAMDDDFVLSAYRPTSLLFTADGTTAYATEQTGVLADAYVESGPIQLGDGDRLINMQKVIPDGALSGDDITVFAGTFPDQAESSSVGGGGGVGPLNLRLKGRYLRYKQTLESASSRVGIPRLGVIESSRR